MKKLYRSQRDKKISGLCGGLAEMMNVDATLLRLVVLVTAFFSAGTTILLYFAASLVIPKEPLFNTRPSNMDNNVPFNTASKTNFTPPPVQSDIDEMMKDIEKKALKNEIDQLRAKLAEYEKGDK